MFPLTSEFEVSSPPHVPGLAVSRRLEPEPRPNGGFHRLNRHQVHAFNLRTVDRERIDLTRISAVPKRPPRVRDGGLEADATVANVAGLALDAYKLATLIDARS